jgi:hypothetical protein
LLPLVLGLQRQLHFGEGPGQCGPSSSETPPSEGEGGGADFDSHHGGHHAALVI